MRELGSNHRLILNKFPIVSSHCLVCSREFRPQGSELTVEDMERALHVVEALDGLGFYNSGPNSGFSQQHLHVQVSVLAYVYSFCLYVQCACVCVCVCVCVLVYSLVVTWLV